MIVNADTPEQLNKVILSAPGFSVCDLEVYPLTDFAKAADEFIDICSTDPRHTSDLPELTGSVGWRRALHPAPHSVSRLS
jgi:hypothetical protein